MEEEETLMKLVQDVRSLLAVGRLGAVAAFIACGAGCASQVSPVRDPVAHAEALLPTLCGDVSASERASVVLATSEPVAVQPAAGVRPPSDGFPRGFPKGPRAPELEGASLQFAAGRGVTAAWLQRQLECHQSEVLTGRAPLTANDPYVLSNGWLDIQVKELGSVFVVETHARGRKAAEEALDRAMRFRVARQGSEPQLVLQGAARAASAKLDTLSTSATE